MSLSGEINLVEFATQDACEAEMVKWREAFIRLASTQHDGNSHDDDETLSAGPDSAGCWMRGTIRR